ncbi:glycoside hydrolase family 72 protein [Emericellopsis atlantica]|uniref:1,3-beta-glucanosyltransferase n=1 Tax=Emericellopsis atlantica TaxID=2614577 RepID=A0A9P8CR65_9HYPO|nr:glycoside hydrolase family 72 protein [Emericellopsis atlantica]KAG9256408.1 glycoside hydrolase family 72 protein [Emericellopsis atlantica]
MRWFSCGAILALAATTSAIDPIEVKGNKFFRKDGSQFFLKGVSYQLRPEDPLIDTDQCRRDAELMQKLGTNALRVYHVDDDADHDGCMKAFADAGIYLLIGLDTFDTYITPSNQCWSTRQYKRFAKVMDAFEGYDNVLAFFVGNENIAAKEDSPGAPFLKAAVRDMRAYRDDKKYRKIPIGYTAADIAELRPMLQDYLTCGGNSSETIEFFGLNSYSWCDPSTYEESSYAQLQKYAKDFPVPIFFSETGCNVPGPRLWDDMDAIFGKHMVDDWSGAIIYEWIQEQNNYGIISYGPPVGDPSKNDETVFDNWTRKGTPTPVSPDFENLKTKWESNNPTGVSRDDYDPDHVSTRACPTSTEGGWWQIDGDARLPRLDETVTAYAELVAAMSTATDQGDSTKTASSGEASTTGDADESGTATGDAGSEETEDADSSGGRGQTMAMCATLIAAVLGVTVWL